VTFIKSAEFWRMNWLSRVVGTWLVLFSIGGIAFCGGINGLPGGLRCADVLNNGVEHCEFTLFIGSIDAKTTMGVKALLEYRRQSNRQIVGATVYLNSPGGSVTEAMAVGRLIRREGMSVVVERGANCASACVFVLAAGTSRRIDGTVGIHRPYIPMERGGVPVTADAIERAYGGGLQAARAYLREMGAAERLADDMLRIEPNRIRILTRPELENYSIGERGPDGDIQKKAIQLETLNLKAAQAYGLSRAEYMRREAIVEKSCKLDGYAAPGTLPDFSIYGELVGEVDPHKNESWASWLARSAKVEEEGWSSCYKTVMRSGHAK
jgi:hypothetical protein